MTPCRPTRRNAPALAVLSIATLFASGGAALRPAAATEPSSADESTLEAYRRALTALERAVRALGGEEGARGLEAVSFVLEANAVAPYQGPTPDPPFLEVPVVLAVDAAPARRWARVETTTKFPEVEFHTLRVLGPTGAAEVDPGSGVATAAAFAWEDLERDLRRSPHLVVRDAWERRSELRWLGPATLGGLPVDLVAFPFLGRRQLTLAIDAEGRLVRHDFLVDDLRTGDAVVSARFLGYRHDGSRWVPSQFQQWEAGVAAVDGTYSSFAAGSEVAAARFEAALPPPAPAADGRREAAAAVEPARGLLEIAPGVHLVRRIEGRDYSSLVVDLGSAYAVVEAPLGPRAAREILDAVRTLDPAKPIRYVVATHFHDDHAGGVPYLVAETGAALVTTPGNAAFFRTATAARRTLRDSSIAPRGPAELVLVADGALELPGEQPLRLLDIGPTLHAEEMLVAWLPASGILFQADVIAFPEDGSVPPAREAARRLASYLAEHGLSPERIAGVHGRVGAAEELDSALAAAAE